MCCRILLIVVEEESWMVLFGQVRSGPVRSGPVRSGPTPSPSLSLIIVTLSDARFEYADWIKFNFHLGLGHPHKITVKK